MSQAVGGDRLQNCLWRTREGGAVEALTAAGKAVKCDIIVLVGLNDVLSRGKVDVVVGGVCEVVRRLKGLRSERTFVHVLEVPLLHLFDRLMLEEAQRINNSLKSHSEQLGFHCHQWEPRLLERSGIQLCTISVLLIHHI